MDHFLDYFASDRSHMIKKKVGEHTFYQSKPPSYPCITNCNQETNNLFDKYLNILFKEKFYGILVKLDMIIKLFMSKT